MSKFKTTIVISLGGSLIFPDQIDVDFLRQFKNVILHYVRKDNRVILVTGGGKICRKYNQAAKKLNKYVTNHELDWMGIKATKVNAELIRIMFDNMAYYKVIDKPEELLKTRNNPIIVSGGWKPGASSDNMAVNLAKKFKASKVVNLTNIDYVYDKDPNKYKTASKFEKITWDNFRQLIGNKWQPGLNAPFDPIASKLAQELKLEVVILNGRKLKNLSCYLNNMKFIGTIIK